MACPGLVQAAQGVPGTRCSLYSLDRTGLFALEKEAMDVMSQDSHFLLYFCMVHFKLNVPDSHELVRTTARALTKGESREPSPLPAPLLPLSQGPSAPAQPAPDSRLQALSP